jgi:type II secretory pathway component PulJ
VIIMTVVYGIVITMALLAGGAIGLLLTVAHYHLLAARHQRYEQEIARDRQLRTAAQAALQHYKSTGSRNG